METSTSRNARHMFARDDDSPIYDRRTAERRNELNGLHWFEPATLRFFASRISEGSFAPCESRKCTYFVSSEQFHGSNGYDAGRFYTVRAIAWKGGDVRTVGKFQQYKTRATAARWAGLYAAGTLEPGESAVGVKENTIEESKP